MSALDDLWSQFNSQQNNTQSASDYSGSSNYQSNDTYPASSDTSLGGSELDALFNDFQNKQEEQQTQPTYSVQQAAQQANGGQSFLNTAMTDVTGATPAQPTAPISKADVKTTPERDALIEEYKRISNSNAIPATRRRDEIRSRLNEIDTELGNGAMDYTLGDRTSSVLGGAVKGYGADMLNAGATAAAGLSQLGEKLGGDTGEYAGWATDEVSRAAIPQQNDAGYYEQQRQEIADMQDTSDRLAQSSAEDINRAKNGTSGVTKFAVDIGTNAIQMGMDGLAATLTGGASLVPMFARSMGGGAREARQDGATTGQQLLYGTVKGGIEVATEKMFDGLAGIYGKGTADEAVEKLITKLGNGSNTQMTALRTLFSGLGEAVEEGISGGLDPFTKMIYQGIDSLPKNLNSEALSDTLYSMLVGFAMGGAGGAVNIVNGENARLNAEAQANLQQQNAAQQTAPAETNTQTAETTTASQPTEKTTVEPTPSTPQQAESNAPSPQQTAIASEANNQTADNSAPSVSRRSVEEIDAEIAPIQAEIAEIDNLISENQEAARQQASRQSTLAEAQAIQQQAQTVVDSLNEQKAPLQERVNALTAERRSVTSEQNRAAEQRRWENRGAKGAKKVPNPQPETHIDNRTTESVSKSNVNAFQYDNPEVKPFYKRAAEVLMRDLGYMQSSKRSERGNGTVFGASNQFLEKVSSYFGSLNDAIEACEQIIYDKGRENFADPKRIELFLDEMLSNGYEPVDTSLPIIQSSSEYLALKGNLQGGTQYDPRARAIRAEMDSDFTGSMTEAEAGEIVDRNYAETGFYDPYTRDGQTDTSVNEGRQSFEDIDAADTASVEAKYGRNNTTENAANTAESANESSQGAETPTTGETASTGETGELNSKPSEPWTPPTNRPGSSEPKVSQTSTNSMRNTAEQNGAEQEDLTYIPKSERESLNNAMNRVAADKVGEMNSLIGKEMWTGEDIDTAMTIYGQLKYDSVQQHDSAAADAWAKIVQEHGTRSGQALQAFAKWARTGKAAQMDIDSMIDATEGLTDGQKQTIKEDVHKFTEQFDNIKDGDVDSVRKLILEQNEYRKTGTFSKKRFEKLLNEINDFDWLKEFALRQARNIPADFTEKPSLGQKLKTWQVNSQLSRVGTFFRNLGGNLSFGGIDIFSQDAFGYTIDNLVSKYTGKKEVGFDKGWLSKTARNAAVDAMHRSILEVAADVDMSGQSNAYGTTSSRTFKMASGNKAQQVMSRWEQLLGYSLTTSDRFFRGQLEQSYAESLMAQGIDETEARNLAKQVADYRLFQNQGKAATLSKGLHDLGNILSIGNKETGQFGLGDLLNPYPGVPANLAVKALEYSPANIVKGGYEIVKLLNDAKAGKAVSGQQMQAVMDVARGMSGTAIIALFTALAKTGLFKNSDDEDDYDVAAMNSAQNLSGTQWNLSATMRAMQGDKAEWKDGDTLMKISWLEPMSAFMGIASMIAESDDENPDLASMSSLYLEGAYKAALDLPVFENIQNVFNTFKYSTGDSLWQKGLEAGAQFAGDALGGMIPAPVSQTARVMDDYVRDTKGDTKAETAYNAFLNSIPGLRNTLPVKTDNFGNARENEPSMYNRFMNSFVRPGAINTFRETAVQDELSRIYDATGDAALYPDRNGPKSITVNGEKVTLSADESRAFHEFAGQKSEEYVNALIESKSYKLLDDKQKSAAIKEMYSIAEGLAKDAYISGNGLTSDSVSDGTALLGGVDKAGTSRDKTPLDEANLANYITYTELMKSSIKSGDYETLDKQIGFYKGMNENLKTVLTERNTDLKRMLEYRDIGLGSETYTKVKAAIPDAQNELDANSNTGSLVRLYGLAKANIPERDRANIIQNLVQGSSGFVGANAKAAYKTLSQYGMSVEQTAQFFDIALNCATYKDSGDPKDFKGKLTPENTAFALSQIPGMSDSQRTAAYNAIRSQVSNYYNDWGTYTYASEIKWFTNPKNKATYSTKVRISQKADALIETSKAS